MQQQFFSKRQSASAFCNDALKHVSHDCLEVEAFHWSLCLLSSSFIYQPCTTSCSKRQRSEWNPSICLLLLSQLLNFTCFPRNRRGWPRADAARPHRAASRRWHESKFAKCRPFLTQMSQKRRDADSLSVCSLSFLTLYIFRGTTDRSIEWKWLKHMIIYSRYVFISLCLQFSFFFTYELFFYAWRMSLALKMHMFASKYFEYSRV